MSISIGSTIKLESQITEGSQSKNKPSGFEKMPIELVKEIFSKYLTYAEMVRTTYLLAKDYTNLLPNHGVLDLSILKNLTDKKFINIIDRCKAKNKKIVALNLSEYVHITDATIVYVIALQHLKILNISKGYSITDGGLENITALEQLTSLDLSHCVQIKDLSFLKAFLQLKTLNLSGCVRVTDLSPLKGLLQLTTLILSGCNQITDLSPLAGLLHLTIFKLPWCFRVTNLSPLAGLSNLRILQLSGCSQITDLSPIAGLSNLRILQISGCSQITDFSPLAALLKLMILDLSLCKQIRVENLDFLKSFYRLKTLVIYGCDSITISLEHLRELEKQQYPSSILECFHSYMLDKNQKEQRGLFNHCIVS